MILNRNHEIRSIDYKVKCKKENNDSNILKYNGTTLTYNLFHLREIGFAYEFVVFDTPNLKFDPLSFSFVI